MLMPEEDGGLYDIAEFINYGIRMTAAFLDYQKDLLQSDFDMLLMKDKLFAEYDTLQYLYLMESKDNMRDTYTSTNFNTHLMPIGVHAFNHLDVVNKIIDENMPVREVYDINSVQDWFRYEFMYLAKGNVLYKQCKNCGRFFIPSGRSDSEYCERIDTAGWTPENALYIFPRKNLPNGAKLPVKSVNFAKRVRLPLQNFRLG